MSQTIQSQMSSARLSQILIKRGATPKKEENESKFNEVKQTGFIKQLETMEVPSIDN